ncbi:MAG: hypothetical protein CMH49_07940 [Myxococcales bacterium]|nr:hypothetical protein [Myxococcales bacterium]
MSDKEQTNDLLKEFEPLSLELLDDHIQLQIHSAKSVFNELLRLIKSITLYGAEHQSSLSFRARFFEVMTEALSKGDDLVIEVQTYALVIADQIIYEDPKVEGNFIYRFYTDGIRELRFKRGISSEEVDRLLNIFLLDWSVPSLFEDDAVTMIWSQKFEHIKYVVATQYNEDTQEAAEYLFNFTDELNRLSDYCRTAQSYVRPAAVQLGLSAERAKHLEHLKSMNKRELLEKLISLSHETQSKRAQKAGQDRFVQLLDKLAQLFAQEAEVSDLERLMRQAMFVATPKQLEQLIDCWAVPVFMQQVMFPLKSSDHPQALSALACVKLLGTAATSHMARALGEVSEQHIEALNHMILPYLDQHPIELCRVVRTADFLHNKRLIPLLYSSSNDALCLQVFQTGWEHQDQGVRYEVLLSLPERLYGSSHLVKALIEGLQDTYSKIRTLSSYRLSKLEDSESRVALKQHLNQDGKDLALVDLRKLFAALALMGEGSQYFADYWSQHSGGLSLSAFSSKGRHEGHCILIALALSQEASQHRATLEKATTRKLGGASFVEAAQWGLAYLDSNEGAQDQMIYELFFRNQLSLPKGRQR